MEARQDILIIGGGINGAGIAADASGRGLSVTLCEENDLASATSSASSKLIHGGLRYLEHYQFRLVREALKEREILLKKAPHLIKPLRFVMPYKRSMRPAWMLHAGFFLYDYLSNRTFLKKSEKINLQQHAAGQPLLLDCKKAFIYSDCFVDDARLVVENALQAKQQGATILTRTRFTKAKRHPDFWEVEMENVFTGEKITLQANILINATGPWAKHIASQQLQAASKIDGVLVKGSHIVVPKIHSDQFAYILQNNDGRMIFIIPFLEEYSLIGTTDVLFSGNPRQAEITQEEVVYLLNAVNAYFRQSISSQDIVWAYSGVRLLQEDDPNKNPATLSREYKIELDCEQAPLVSIFGGKLTTYRKLAEKVLNLLQPFLLNTNKKWTANAPLPGGDFKEGSFELFYKTFQQNFPWLPSSLMNRYTKTYGSLAFIFLNKAKTLEDLGQDFGYGLYQCELDYLMEQEWAKKAEDVLWRRTKLGFNIPKEQYLEFEKTINDYISKRADT